MADRISTPGKTKQIIDKYGFYIKKGYGQNFLVDTNIIEKIVDASGVSENDCILEIGPGVGSLTELLAERAKKVIAVEIDKNLIPILKETLKKYDNIKLINKDILKIDINKLIEEENEGKPVKVIANLPYYITTPIVMELLEKCYNIENITIMVQKEVAMRMKAGPGDINYGALSVGVSYYSDVNINFFVHPGSFMPVPKVDSAVITLNILKNPKISVINEKVFFRVVSAAFGQRRKTLSNSLKNQLKLDKEDINSILKSMELDERARGETLDIYEFGTLSNLICELDNNSDN